ncbi:hypothetical protein MMC25_005912 [Agyrium rufum]|nr:hypothetical protein [Agyrium rufum]
MAFWPFGGRKKNTETAATSEKRMGVTTTATATRGGKLAENSTPTPGQGSSDVNASRIGRVPSRKGSHRERKGATKLSKSRLRPVEREKHLQGSSTIPPVPNNAAWARPPFTEKSPNTRSPDPRRGDVPSYYFQNTLSQSSIQPENFNTTLDAPTLRPKNSGQDTSMSRGKSAKRKAEDNAREKEIRLMSNPIPIPKRGSYGKAERPTSNVSLAHADSTKSKASNHSDGHNFTVSAFDALSPRPTIRYSENPRYRPKPRSTEHSRASARKDKGPPIPEEGFNSKEKIDNLADDLDTTALRELMERDRRRRDKKRKVDQEKLQRRLQRRAEKQRVELEDEKSPRKGKSKGLIGLGVQDPQQPPEMEALEPPRVRDTASPSSWLADQSSREQSPARDPFQDPTRADSKLGYETFVDAPEKPQTAPIKIPQSKSIPPSPALPMQNPSYLATLSDLASRSTTDVDEKKLQDANRRNSDTSARFGGSWTSFFRRSGVRGSRGSAEPGQAPSEFSNTSRESFARSPPNSRTQPSAMPPSAFQRNVRARSGTPVRTQSKFREDLPELPLSPPRSRVQIPLVGHDVPALDVVPGTPVKDAASPGSAQPLAEIHPAFRDEIAIKRRESTRVQTPEVDAPSAALISQSMASVDSEGSWLSGRPGKRSSNPLRGSTGSLHQRLRDMGASAENVRRAETELERPDSGDSSGNTLAAQMMARRKARRSNDGDDEGNDRSRPQSPLTPPTEEEPKFHAAVARHPTIVRKLSPRAKSREGLLDIFNAGEGDDAEAEDSASPVEDSPVSRRANQAKRYSTGSARLMNVPARGSMEGKRLSGSSSVYE